METPIARPGSDGRINVAGTERILSLVAGGILALDGMRRRSAFGAAEALVGSALLERGVTGHCRLYEAAGMSTADEAGAPEHTPARRMVLVQQAHTIAREALPLYEAWRNFEQLPRFMHHLERVEVLSQAAISDHLPVAVEIRLPDALNGDALPVVQDGPA